LVVGCLEGWDVGCDAGWLVGCREGWDVGCRVGCPVGKYGRYKFSIIWIHRIR
jgi:hypothetical protein